MKKQGNKVRKTHCHTEARKTPGLNHRNIRTLKMVFVSTKEIYIMTGTLINSIYAYRKYAKVNPVPHHYEEPGEPPYVKWHCPVCAMLGNRKTSIPKNIPDCPLCGVHLNWDRKPEIGDQVLIVDSERKGIIQKSGNPCTVLLDDGTSVLQDPTVLTILVQEEKF